MSLWTTLHLDANASTEAETSDNTEFAEVEGVFEAPATSLDLHTTEATEIGLDEPSQTSETNLETTADKGSFWTTQTQGMQWGWVAMAGLILVLLIEPLSVQTPHPIQGPGPHRVFVPHLHPPKRTWRFKGTSQTTASFPRQLLQVGVIDAPNTPPRRLPSQATCTRRQQLLFGLIPSAPGGYLYVFRVVPSQKEAPELLYPMTPGGSKPLQAGVLFPLQQNGQPLLYPLDKEAAHVWFVALQTAQPLSAKQLQWLQTQKRGWNRSMKVLEGLKQQKPVFFDRFTLHMK